MCVFEFDLTKKYTIYLTLPPNSPLGKFISISTAEFEKPFRLYVKHYAGCKPIRPYTGFDY